MRMATGQLATQELYMVLCRSWNLTELRVLLAGKGPFRSAQSLSRAWNLTGACYQFSWISRIPYMHALK